MELPIPECLIPKYNLRVTGTISYTLAAPQYEGSHIVVSGTPSQTPNGSFESLIDRVMDRATPTFRMYEIDPLDVMYNGIRLRGLLVWNERNQRECKTNGFTHRLDPVQRAAVSAHWSAELRAKVAASKERDKHQVMMQIDADDL